MLDFILGVYFAGLAVRGWRRGLVREAINLGVLLVGAVTALRMARPIGDFLTDRFGWIPETAVLSGGAGLFVLLAVGGGWLAPIVTRLVRIAGLTLPNRLGGVGVAALWGLAVVFVLTTLLRGLPLPESVDGTMETSRVLRTIEPVQERFIILAGDRVVSSVAVLESLGAPRWVPVEGDEFSIPASDRLDDVPNEALMILELINRHRLSAGTDPLAWSDGLAAVGRGHAEEMYRTGYLAHNSPTTGDLADRLQHDDLPVVEAEEVIALAASGRAAYAAMLDVEEVKIGSGRFDRAAVVAISGPSGLLVVVVLAG